MSRSSMEREHARRAGVGGETIAGASEGVADVGLTAPLLCAPRLWTIAKVAIEPRRTAAPPASAIGIRLRGGGATGVRDDCVVAELGVGKRGEGAGVVMRGEVAGVAKDIRPEGGPDRAGAASKPARRSPPDSLPSLL
jgi:hypothetical protein